MKTEFLKGLGLTEDQIKSVMAENGKDVQAEKDKLSKIETELEGTKTQLKEASTTINDLKKNNINNEELQTKVKEYESTIKTQKADYEVKVRNLTLDSAIEKALASSKAKHTDLLSTKIDREKLVISEDGKVSGLDEQVKGLKESYKDLFEEKISGREPAKNGDSILLTKEQFNKMGYQEKLKLYTENKNLYEEMKGSN